MDVFWFLPTHGDGHYLGTTQGARPVTLNYLKQVAQAADSLGYRLFSRCWVAMAPLLPLIKKIYHFLRK